MKGSRSQLAHVAERHRRAGSCLGSFDYFVGAGEQRGRHGEAERLCSLHVDNEIELGRLLDRNVSRLRPTQNLVNKLSSAPELVSLVRSVRHQTSRFNKLTEHVQCRQSCTDGKSVDLGAVGARDRVHDNIKRVRPAPNCLKARCDVDPLRLGARCECSFPRLIRGPRDLVERRRFAPRQRRRFCA